MRMPSHTSSPTGRCHLKLALGLVQLTMGQRILKMEYRRFLRRLVQIPCQILQRGRRLL